MKPLTILMVGKTQASCIDVVATLRAKGFEADWLALNDEALQIGHEETVDIFFLDLACSDDCGVQLATRIRQKNPEVGILMTIKPFDKDARRNALAAGADNFVYTPFHMTEVLACINRLSRWLSL